MALQVSDQSGSVLVFESTDEALVKNCLDLLRFLGNSNSHSGDGVVRLQPVLVRIFSAFR